MYVKLLEHSVDALKYLSLLSANFKGVFKKSFDLIHTIAPYPNETMLT